MKSLRCRSARVVAGRDGALAFVRRVVRAPCGDAGRGRAAPLARRALAALACLALLVPAAFAQGQPPAAPPSSHDTLEQRLAGCAACHGKQGEGLRREDYYPRLAGKPAGYLFNQLVAYRDRQRSFAIMNYLVAWLSDDYLREIAAHYERLSPPYPPPATGASAAVLARGEALALRGDPARQLPACAACHGQALTGMAPAIPGLVGLYSDYIASQMGAWKIGSRRARGADCMRDIAQQLTAEDIAAVSAWLAARPTTGDLRPLPAGALKLPVPCGVSEAAR